MKKNIVFALCLWLGMAGGYPFSVESADLDDLYTPLIAPDQWLYTLQGEFYTMWENGHHGSASFDSFYSNPDQFSLLNALRFSPAAGWDVQLGYEHTFPSSYIRSTENPSDVVTSYQRYFLNSGSDYTLDLRYRGKAGEYYLNFLEKRYKTGWNFATSQTGTPSFFNYFHSQYEDIRIGGRYMSSPDDLAGSLFPRPSVSDGQLAAQWELGYRNGRLNRTGHFYVADTQHRSYNQETRPHVLPRVDLRYGLSPALELAGALSYSSWFKYIYDFRQYKNSGLTNFVNGTYSLKNNIEFPVALRYRPSQNIEMLTGLDYHFLKQNFESWEKAENNTVTDYPTKKLWYHNFKPRLEFNYITTPPKETVADPLEALTKKLLARRQWVLSFNAVRDITHLKKNDANGALNVADPYNAYLYPVENFVSGTEHAAFISGNSALTPANVGPQNYLEFSVGGRYGLSDNWEIGLKAGYRGPSHVHQYSIGDRSSRFITFKEYYYVDFSTDMNIAKNNLLSFQLHFVPDYETILDSSVSPKAYQAHTRYVEASLSFKRLF